jgi:hypothetical protein
VRWHSASSASQPEFLFSKNRTDYWLQHGKIEEVFPVGRT